VVLSLSPVGCNVAVFALLMFREEAGASTIDRELVAKAATGRRAELEPWPPTVSSRDGRHSFALTGRLHLDGRLDPTGRQFDSGVVVRRARIGFRAKAFDRLEADLAVQSSLGSFSFENAFVEVEAADWLRLRAGQMLRPFGLQRGITSNALVHPERAVAVEKLAEFRDVGVLMEVDLFDESLELQLGVFEGSNALQFDTPPDLAVRARADPVDALVFDLGYRWSPPMRDGELPEDASTSGNQLAPVIVYDRDAAARQGSRHGVSTGARVVAGPVMMHGELLVERTERVEVAGRSVGTLTDFGGVFDFAWAITGERQSQEELEPLRRLRARGTGAGAWQIALRYQMFATDPDALTARVAAGSQFMQGGAASLIWTPAPHVRWMVSYDYTRLHGATAGAISGPHVHAVLTRLDFHF
jgi:phosphate-selective porin